MTNMFSQYPAGTTGTFTVNADGSVKLDVTIPKTHSFNITRVGPKRHYGNKRCWVMDGNGLPRSKVKEYLRSQGVMWAFVDHTDNTYYFALTPNFEVKTSSRIAETDRTAFETAVDQSGWHRLRHNGLRVINVRDVP